MNTATETFYKELPCIELCAGGYKALIAHTLGGNVIRLRNECGVEFFRFDENLSISELADSIEVYGLPAMYLPNRLNKGELRTSDGFYKLPVNEKPPYRTCIHGFLHRRAYTIEKISADDSGAEAVIRYLFDENDSFYKYLPLKFKAEIRYVLSENGLEHFFTLENLSEKQLPVSLATHTAIGTPFDGRGRQEDVRLTAPIGECCELNLRCLPSGRLLPLESWDTEYIRGEKCPVLQVLNNEMFTAQSMEIDGKPFHGIIISDIGTGSRIFYETGEEYGFWIFWNDGGQKGYFCPEPMTAMIDAPNLSLPREITGYRELAPEKSFTAYQRIFTR